VAAAVDGDVGAVALEDGFAGVTGAGDDDPVRVAGVAGHGAFGRDGERVEFGLSVVLLGMPGGVADADGTTQQASGRHHGFGRDEVAASQIRASANAAPEAHCLIDDCPLWTVCP